MKVFMDNVTSDNQYLWFIVHHYAIGYTYVDMMETYMSFNVSNPI